jgi:hypothetical protein
MAQTARDSATTSGTARARWAGSHAAASGRDGWRCRHGGPDLRRRSSVRTRVRRRSTRERRGLFPAPRALAQAVDQLRSRDASSPRPAGSRKRSFSAGATMFLPLAPRAGRGCPTGRVRGRGACAARCRGHPRAREAAGPWPAPHPACRPPSARDGGEKGQAAGLRWLPSRACASGRSAPEPRRFFPSPRDGGEKGIARVDAHNRRRRSGSGPACPAERHHWPPYRRRRCRA